MDLDAAFEFSRYASRLRTAQPELAARVLTAIDRPASVDRLAILNVIPTVDQFERMAGGPSLGYWPWFLLASARVTK